MINKQIFISIFSRLKHSSFAVEYWDGEQVHYGEGPADFTLVLKDESVCAGLLGNPNIRFGEAYTSGAIEVLGDLRDVFRAVFLNRLDKLRPRALESLRIRWAALSRRNSLAGAKLNVTHHYDVGNDFYKLWLGREMVYSCAYFEDPGDGIDAAQEQKFRHLCAKLRLRGGETLLDIGCGWGGLLIYAAREFAVRAVGTTLSQEQLVEARERITGCGLADRVTVELRDYRELPPGTIYDKVVSVGMLEHVGKNNLNRYMSIVARLLRKGGVGVIQSIGHQRGAPTDPWLQKHIFPGTYLPALSEITGAMERAGLVVTDVEELRRHYALTFERWSQSFEDNVSAIRALYDERFVRMWRLYLRSVTASFQYGDHRLFQIQFSSGLNDAVPLTRRYLYGA